jgi:hypothetical protein
MALDANELVHCTCRLTNGKHCCALKIGPAKEKAIVKAITTDRMDSRNVVGKVIMGS